MSKFERKDVPLFICKDCPALKGTEVGARNKDFTLAWRSRCVLCGRKMEALGMASDLKPMKVKKGVKLPEGAKRFPRLLSANPEQEKNVGIIENRTRDFDAPGKVTDVHIGPVVTEYEFTPDKFTRFRQIKGLQEDLQISMAAQSCIISSVPGKSSVAICLPNLTRTDVLFSETVKETVKHRDTMEVPINMGVDIRGKAVTVDLADMPHMLVAGSTNAGKSVFINNVINSILSTRTPKQVKFVFIDPKQVELSAYRDIPHLWNGLKPVATPHESLNYLELLIQETKGRMARLNSAGFKNIKEYNDSVRTSVKTMKAAMLHDEAKKREADLLPYIVLIIDEMAELMLAVKKDFTDKLASIVAVARAAGILVLGATQRPSVDVINGRIKTNFPARVAFRLPDSASSRTILNSIVGAEKLLGQGDMLFINPLQAGVQRMHGPFVKKDETERIVKLVTELRVLPADYEGPDPLVNLKEAIDYQHMLDLQAAGKLPAAPAGQKARVM